MVVQDSQSPGLSSSENRVSIPIAVPRRDEHEATPSSTSSLLQFLKHNKGLLIIVASQFFFSLMELSVKFLMALEDPVPMLEVIAVRMGITYICSQAYMFAAGVSDPILGPKDVRAWLVIRGVSGFIGLFGLYYSLQYLSLSDVTVLYFLTPIITAGLGILFLREAASWKQGVAGVVSLFGVILIAKPTSLFGESEHTGAGTGAEDLPISEVQRIVAVGGALVGVLGGASAYFTIRVIGKRAHPMHMMTHFSIWSVLVSVAVMRATDTKWVLPIQWTWSAMLVLVGIFGFVAQLLLTLGLQLETASRGSIAFYTKIVFALVLQRIAFGVSPSGQSLVGICAIMASAIYVALNKPSKESSKLATAPSTTARDRNGSAEETRGLLAEYDHGDTERNAGYGGVDDRRA